tara:strand:- start:3526 stop:4326 length:801 start_codon:yes stop_codon:yes gene_type:complete
MPDAVDPRSKVWSAIGWDGSNSLMAADMHFARIKRHAVILDIDVPNDFEARVYSMLDGLGHPGDANPSPDQASFLIAVGVSKDEGIFVEPYVISTYPKTPLSAISLTAPNWNQPVRGTKHGDWEPHREARKIAMENGADIALLFEDEILVDGDRCAPLLLDHDGIAYHPKNSDGALDSVTIEQIRDGLESSGIPVRPAKITLNMILRSSEMIVCGSGMGIRAIGTIDGRKIGNPEGRLFESAHKSWLHRIKNNWMDLEKWRLFDEN